VTQSPNQRLDRIEDEFETVKQLLASAARYAESANEGLERLTEKQDRTQTQLDQLVATAGDTLQQTERLEAIILRLDRNYEAQQAQLQELQRSNQEFQQSTTAALERIDRVLDYLLRQQGGSR